MNMNNIIEIAIIGDTVFFKVKGHAGAEIAEDFREAFLSALHDGCNFIIDMSECSYIDSTFIGIMIYANKETVARNSKMVVLNLTPPVRNILRSMGLLDFLTVETSETFTHISSLQKVPHHTDEKEMLEGMILAHKTIIDTDSSKSGEFVPLLKFLERQAEIREDRS